MGTCLYAAAWKTICGEYALKISRTRASSLMSPTAQNAFSSIRGNLLLIFGSSSIFLLGALGQGFLISVVARSQLLASQIAIVTTFLPSFLLSGFVYAISNMPKPIQVVTHLITARYFIVILKGIYMKGIGVKILWMEGIFLVIFAVLITVLSNAKFKKKLI